ncbi:MAG: hypothetical protein V4539_25085 [Bacteroidota bacterium]
MKKIFSVLIVAFLTITAFSTQASAQRNARLSKETRKALLDSLSPEQKKAFRDKLKNRYDSLSPDQKQKIKQELKSKLDSLPPKERKQMRQELIRNRRKANG